MNRFLPKLALACAFAAGAMALTASADDPKPGEKKKPDDKKPAEKKPDGDKPEKKPADKPADWSNFVKHGDPVTGEVMKADESGITLRISGVAPKGNAYGGLSRKGGGLKEAHEDFDLKYADGGQARWKKLPPKTGPDGKKANYTDKEMTELRKPQGFGGYAAEKTDVKQGHVVELILVRPKSIPAAKATNEDLQIKQLTITGEMENPSKPDRSKGKEKEAPKKVKDS